MTDGIDLLDLAMPGTQILSIGAGMANGDEPPVPTDPRREYVSVGPVGLVGGELGSLDFRRGPGGWHSLARYERMARTPAAGSSFNAIRTAVLAQGVALLPSVKAPTANTKPIAGQEPGTAVEAEMASTLADSNRRTLNAWATPLNLVLWEALEAMIFGHVVAEPVAADVTGGPDDGLLALSRVKLKPRSSHRFVVDHAMNVVGHNCLALADDGKGTEWRRFEADDLAWLTWDPYRGDPRGRSIFGIAEDAWERLEQLWPEIMKGWKQFGTPWTWGTTAPNARMVAAADAKGQPIPGQAPTTAEFAMAMAMQRMKNGDAAAGPNGSDVKVVESNKDATIVSGAISILEAQIIQAILLQTRATTEAKHGSRADSQTGQDIMGTLVRFVRIWLERWVRSLLMRQNAWNYGEDIARRCTPLVDLGSGEHQDFAAVAAGVGVLFQSRYFERSQLQAVDTMLGLPQRDPNGLRVGPDGAVSDDMPADPSTTATPPDEQAPTDAAPAEGVAS